MAGFRGRPRPGQDLRLPPGQYDAGQDWPVLTAEVTPTIDLATWTLGMKGLVERPVTWRWEEVLALPSEEITTDVHCVTSWSKFGMRFRGVSLDTLLGLVGVRPAATHVYVRCHSGYTTNLSLGDVVDGKAWVVWEAEGEPLPREHGGPARLLVPGRYLWKSAKWVSEIELLDHDERGFWELYGYHDIGDPWLEQRYRGD